MLEDHGVDAIPADGFDDRIKHDNLVVQYSRAMSYLREILNHTFLRAVYHTSSKQAKLEYEEVQRNFINDHANDDPDDEPVKFTALDIKRIEITGTVGLQHSDSGASRNEARLPEQTQGAPHGRQGDGWRRGALGGGAVDELPVGLRSSQDTEKENQLTKIQFHSSLQLSASLIKNQ